MRQGSAPSYGVMARLFGCVSCDLQQDQHGATFGASLARAFRKMRASIFDYRDNIILIYTSKKKTVFTSTVPTSVHTWSPLLIPTAIGLHWPGADITTSQLKQRAHCAGHVSGCHWTVGLWVGFRSEFRSTVVARIVPHGAVRFRLALGVGQ